MVIFHSYVCLPEGSSKPCILIWPPEHSKNPRLKSDLTYIDPENAVWFMDKITSHFRFIVGLSWLQTQNIKE